MTPRVDDFDNLSSTDDDDDDGFKEDMAALSRACRIAVPGADDNSAAEDGVPSEDPLNDTSTAIVPVTDSDSDDQDDLECLKRVQSLYQPLSVLPPLAPSALSDDDDDEDDLETVRAIMKRFGDYNEGI